MVPAKRYAAQHGGDPRGRPAVRSVGYQRCLTDDVDSLGYTNPGPAEVITRVLHQARAGSVVSLHLGHRGTVAVLPGVLAGLQGRGLPPVTVRALVGRA